MSMNQHQHEYRVMTIIGNFHRESIQAEQRRLARTNRPNHDSSRSPVGSAGQVVMTQRALITQLLRVPKVTALVR